MPTRFTRRQLSMVGASALGASATAAPSGARPGDGAAAGREASRAFPAGFLWGTATAAYQIEGAVSEDGRGPSIWDTFTHMPGKIRNDDNGDVSDDHYHRYRDDVRSMKALAAAAYRFSISWPRIFPQGTGAPNPKGLDFYNRLLDNLVANDIAPFPTLHHSDLPQALQDRGGWETRDTADAFADYAGYVAEKLSDRARHFFTLNECATFVELGHATGVFAPGLKLPSGRLNQVRHHALLVDLETFRNSGNVIDRNISFGPLNCAQISSVDPAFMRQRFLAKAACRAEPTHVLRQDVPQRSFVRPFHGRNPAD